MRILHVISGLGKSAGTTTFVENVVEGLRARGHDVKVMTVANPCEMDGFDIVHVHGLWESILHASANRARKLGIPFVWSPHGMTAPWSMHHKWWKKIIPWHLYQRWDLKHAAAIHCTTDLEAEWNKALGFANCVVAPLGTQVREVERIGGGGQWKGLVVLFVGRIYPVKGLMNLVKAAALLPRNAVQFRIVGPDQAGYMVELKAQCNRLGLAYLEDNNSTVRLHPSPSLQSSPQAPDFIFTGPKYGDDLEKEYANCDLLVLPSFTENFGVVVIDALAHGKPVIASKFTPWKVLEEERCGWWVDNSPESLAATLREVCGAAGVRALPEMGERGRKLVEERYSWSAICEKMIEVYKSLGVE